MMSDFGNFDRSEKSVSLGDWSEFKEQVRAKTNIVDLIGEGRAVTPRRGGNEYVALCPFHPDRNPSLTINPARQTFMCWVCKEGGDCFSYVMKSENLEFRAALELLANRAGVEMPARLSKITPEQRSFKEEVAAALEWACDQFHQSLRNGAAGEAARDYLLSRNFEEQCWNTFGLGFHPDNWEWLIRRRPDHLSLEALKAAGLIGERDEGRGYYDNFVNRVMFPIRDTNGKTVAFGGRVLPGQAGDSAPKYWNSPETMVFKKSQILFGLDHAKKSIQEKHLALIVEGYTDCIALHNFGFTHTVGTLGTALTSQHVELLRRFCEKAVLVYDADFAGMTAMERSLPQFMAYDFDLKILTLPEGNDPADYLENFGTEAFERLIETAPDGWDFKLKQVIERIGLRSDRERQRVMEEMLELLCQVPRQETSAKEDMWLGRLSRQVMVQEHTIRRKLKELRQAQQRTKKNEMVRVDSAENSDNWFNRVTSGRINAISGLLCELLEVIVSDVSQAEPILAKIPQELDADPELLRFCDRLRDLLEENRLSVHELHSDLTDHLQLQFLVWLESEASRKQWRKTLDNSVANAHGVSSVVADLLTTLELQLHEMEHQRNFHESLERREQRSGLDESTLDLLKKSQAFNSKRATLSRSSQ